MAKQTNIKINVDPTKGAEGSIKKFKRLVEAAGILKEYRKRKEYKKPSIRRKEKLESAQKRRLKEMSKRKRYSKI
jgi:small subunit ribosomal protein S21